VVADAQPVAGGELEDFDGPAAGRVVAVGHGLILPGQGSVLRVDQYDCLGRQGLRRVSPPGGEVTPKDIGTGGRDCYVAMGPRQARLAGAGLGGAGSGAVDVPARTPCKNAAHA